MAKRCHAVAALKIESIFIGRVITIQFKCREANIELHNIGHQRLLSSKLAGVKLEGSSTNNESNNESESNSNNESDSDNESDNASGSESSASLKSPSPKPVKKVVKRRVVRKKVK